MKPYFPEYTVPVDIDLEKLKGLSLGDVYIKQGNTYSVFGAIIAATLNKDEEYMLMKQPIKFKPFAWEYAPMLHIRSKLGWKVTKDIEAIKDLKKALAEGVKACMRSKIVTLRQDQMDLADELGLASI